MPVLPRPTSLMIVYLPILSGTARAGADEFWAIRLRMTATHNEGAGLSGMLMGRPTRWIGRQNTYTRVAASVMQLPDHRALMTLVTCERVPGARRADPQCKTVKSMGEIRRRAARGRSGREVIVARAPGRHDAIAGEKNDLAAVIDHTHIAMGPAARGHPFRELGESFGRYREAKLVVVAAAQREIQRACRACALQKIRRQRQLRDIDTRSAAACANQLGDVGRNAVRDVDGGGCDAEQAGAQFHSRLRVEESAHEALPGSKRARAEARLERGEPRGTVADHATHEDMIAWRGART